VAGYHSYLEVVVCGKQYLSCNFAKLCSSQSTIAELTLNGTLVHRLIQEILNADKRAVVIRQVIVGSSGGRLLSMGALTSLMQGARTLLTRGSLTPQSQGALTLLPRGTLTPQSQGAVTSLPRGSLTPQPQGTVTSLPKDSLTPQPQGALTLLTGGSLTPKP